MTFCTLSSLTPDSDDWYKKHETWKFFKEIEVDKDANAGKIYLHH